jgi:isoquinoline 1-oxidoreductase subunit beta
MSNSAPSAAARDGGLSRRRFIGYLIAGPTLLAGAELMTADDARAALPTIQPVDAYDLSDLLTDATLPTSALITVAVNSDGTVSFALPRAEVGQGITTAVAMTIADEIGVPLDTVNVTLADARPELVWNQLTGGSNSMHSIYTPVRVAAAIARGQLLQAAADELGGLPGDFGIVGDLVKAPSGQTVSIGSLAQKAATTSTRTVAATLKPQSALSLVGTPQRRIDAVDIVTGRKTFAMDLSIPDALPTML